jgi:hypothetical protein
MCLCRETLAIMATRGKVTTHPQLGSHCHPHPEPSTAGSLRQLPSSQTGKLLKQTRHFRCSQNYLSCLATTDFPSSFVVEILNNLPNPSVRIGPGVYSASNRNEYQKHKNNNVSGE